MSKSQLEEVPPATKPDASPVAKPAAAEQPAEKHREVLPEWKVSPISP